MLKVITDKKEYQFVPSLGTDIGGYDLPLRLFGKTWYIMDDYWMKHVHIKITDRCNAACPFCIERDSRIEENRDALLRNVRQLLDEMDEQGHLATVSITGGEPSICGHTSDVIDMVRGHGCFLNINTNFTRIIESALQPSWLNISCHALGEDRYCHIPELQKEKIRTYRERNPDTKIRIQCVLHEKGLKDIDAMLRFMEYYKDAVDDFSFRRLITLDTPPEDDLLQRFKHHLFDKGELLEQVLKDYYVYESWNLDGALITLSHSNMGLLKRMEETEPDNLLREIVVHPDGLISGSWYRNRKIIRNI